MCQLTFINTNNLALNKMLLYNELIINTKTSHRDGTGMFQEGSKVYKTKQAAINIDDFTDKINQYIVNKNPIIAHVRLASFRQLPDDKDSHPFETDKIILAHNGTLIPEKSILFNQIYDDMIDSEIFANELSNVYDGTNFVDAINDTMKLFSGPFAFLIYSKIEKCYYVVRGKTKLLHMSNITLNKNRIGFIVNTDLTDLKSTLRLTKNIFNLNKRFMIDNDEPKLLSEETIYKLSNNELVEVGKIKENDPVKSVFNSDKTTDNKTVVKSSPATNVTKLVEFMLNTSMTIYEVDRMFYSIFNVGLLYINDDDLNTFITLLMPTLLSLYSEHKANLWKSIKDTSGKGAMQLYKDCDIQFPYFINKNKILRHTLNEVILEKKMAEKKANTSEKA